MTTITGARMRREAGRDRKLGEVAAEKREGKVVRGRVKIEEQEPVMIVPSRAGKIGACGEGKAGAAFH